MSLQIITGPSAEPVTLTEVKERLGLTSTADDTRINQDITAARVQGERMTRKSLANKTYLATFNRFPRPGCAFFLPLPPLVSVTSIVYLDNTGQSQTWDPAEYLVRPKQSPGLVQEALGSVYPIAGPIFGAVEVTFVAGYGAEGGPVIPEDLKRGVMDLAIYLYSHPEAVSSEVFNQAPKRLFSVFEAYRVNFPEAYNL